MEAQAGSTGQPLARLFGWMLRGGITVGCAVGGQEAGGSPIETKNTSESFVPQIDHDSIGESLLANTRRKPKRRRKKVAAKKQGRPPGSKNMDKPVEDTYSTCCKKCGSTDREKYWNSRTVNADKVINGVKYKKVIIHNTRCRKCGQARVDRVWK